MSKLSFLGRGSAFTDEHNCAYFTAGGSLVLLDCPMSAFTKVRKTDLLKYDHIYVLVTHTHGDHVGGIGMLIAYAFFTSGTPVTVVAPSEEVRKDLAYLFGNIEGCSDSWYTLITADKLDAPWLEEAIPTTHTEELSGKCFGYSLKIDGARVIYTGDTNTLAPFIAKLSAGDYLYTEVSVHKTAVHLYSEDIREKVSELTEKGIRVFLMHMDDEEKIEKTMEGTGAEFAPLS